MTVADPLPVPPSTHPFSALPSVASLVTSARGRGSTLADGPLTAAVQAEIERVRGSIAAGARPTRESVANDVLAAVAALERPRLMRVLNATGVVVHTNLGRAPVSDEAARAMAEAAANPVALELEPETNERGGRMREISSLMRLLTGAESTLVVNNCAAALVLTLSALTAGREVVVSRGEAVEIGGGFRVPDVMRQSGATLVEVGTTNRTYARDYAEAITERTAAFLKVHASNFLIVGFTHAPTIEELAAAGRPHGVAVLEDLGSGALLDTRVVGLAPEPMLADSLAAGADVVLISGDKLLGGPQAGIIAGGTDWVERIAKHPLARAVRADKTCLAGLAATLRHYANGEALERVPVWRAMAAPIESLQERASAVSAALASRHVPSGIAATEATVGGGSLPGQTLPSWSVTLAEHDLPESDLDRLAKRLRLGTPGVHGRIEHGTLLLDLRTVPPEADDELIEAVVAAWGGGIQGETD
ncbi:MAG TPA: L-seryl-tRNA(Sec) selenium transferase [Thermomicrobiales bacterium]|nr:L-seryl-tRNA(Sec) selenium transferase [Thermomicrobiales bacterium]